MTSFDAFFELELSLEGGYSDHPEDPGGATNMGITLNTLSHWRGKKVTKAQVKALTADEAKEIYRKNYANVVQFDSLPPGVNITVADFAVNSGPQRAAIGLQRALGVADDGIVGKITLEAAEAADPVELINKINDGRMTFLRGLSTFKTFGNGWTARVAKVRSTSLSYAVQPEKPKKGTTLLDIIFAILAAILRRF